MKNQEFIPILLGSDRNVYGMAVAFHEEYQIKSISVRKTDYLETKYSKIIVPFTNPDLENKETFLKVLKDVYNEYKDKKLLLIACSDVYMRLIIENKKELDKYFLIPYIDYDLMQKLVLKEEFYKTCTEYNLEFPRIFICDYTHYKDVSLPFDFPVIIKPSDSVSYWKADFVGKKKVFICYSEEELHDILNHIYSSSYKSNLIIQEYIPGDDTNLRVLNAYVDSNHKVTFMALGQILLEEKTPKSIGDYDAIIPTFDQELFDRMQEFLEKIKYVGYANFDFKYDTRTNSYKLFEINIRQGRSSSFTTVSGSNIVKYLVDDFIYHKKRKIEYLNNKFLWSIVPKGVVMKYTKNNELKETAKNLYKEHKVRNILLYKNDFSIRRYIIIKLKTLRYYSKYKKYYK